jgi:O-antigen ligase
MAALMLSPRGHRLKIALGLVVAVLGGLYLADPGFMGRASTVTESDEERDPSATSRLEIWEGSIRMLKAKPLGVGVGNFYQSIGRYAPEQAERDAHNTYVRCYGELGVQGLAALLAVLLSAFLLLRRTMRQVKDLPQKQRDDITYVAFGVTTSLAALMACSITRTLLYIEFFWWMLAMPVVIWRVAENLRAQGSVVGIAAAPTRSRLPGRSARSSTVAPSPA